MKKTPTLAEINVRGAILSAITENAHETGLVQSRATEKMIDNIMRELSSKASGWALKDWVKEWG